MKMISEKVNEWVELPIEDILSPLANGVILGQGWSPQCEKQPSPTENDWGVLKTTAIQPGKFLELENKLLPAHLSPRTQHEVKSGDLLITCAGPRNRCGIACLVRKTRKKLLISGKMYRFRVNERKAVAEYLEAYLLSQKAWKAIDKMKTGGSDSGLNLTHTRFKTLLVPIPSIETQRSVVSKIEELLSELEKGKQQLETAQQQLKIYRQAVLKWAFVNDRFQDFILKDVTEKIQIGPFSTQLHREDYIENGIPLINPMHIQDGMIEADYSDSISKEKLKSLPNYILKEGDVIMGRRGEMGRCGLVRKKEAG